MVMVLEWAVVKEHFPIIDGFTRNRFIFCVKSKN
jgi:hypothetical protein